MKTKLPAYTVMEMLVVMAISAISIGITYTTYQIFSSQYYGFKKRSEEISVYLQLDKLLTKDMADAEQVLRTPGGVVFKKKDRETYYEFTSEWILRNDLLQDTFVVQPMEVGFFLKGQPQHLPEGLLDELRFESHYKEELLPFRYQKKYGAETWMRIEAQTKEQNGY
jgi:hypothetical protein